MIGWIGTLLASMLLVSGGPAHVGHDAPAVTPARASSPATRSAPLSPATRITLGGVRVALPAGGRQVVTVNHTFGTHARVSLWQRDPGGWRLVARTRGGRTGYGGLVRPWHRRQGTGTTPLGTYGLISSFGTHSASTAWQLPYRTIRRGDFWVEDNRSAYYNRYRARSEGGFRWWLPQSNVNSSERLTDFPTQYELAVVTSFNYAAQVRHRGAGIFLHVNGRGATAGCVSAPRWFLGRTMATLDPALRPVIAIGR